MRIDTSAALRVAGVLDVLTHENRPPMAGRRRGLQGPRGARGRFAVPSTLRRQNIVYRPAHRARARRGLGDGAFRGLARSRRIREEACETDIEAARGEAFVVAEAREDARQCRKGVRGRR